MSFEPSRREFLRKLGLHAASLPFLLNLPSLGFANQTKRKQRLVVMFSPNGIVPKTFWPDEEGENFALKESMKPLEPFKKQTLILHGVCDKVRGDGDSHMRGIGCSLTGIELLPGNVQGGSDQPAGWSRGRSIDQELKEFLQKDPATRTRFGTLEFGVHVPDRADIWTRMVYAGKNKPIAPISDPYQMFRKLYGSMKHQERLKSVLDAVHQDLHAVANHVSAEDRRLLDEHATFVREMERELAEMKEAGNLPKPPVLEPGVKNDNDHMPKTSKMQIDLMVHSFSADFARVATLQYAHSASDTALRWLNIDGFHHNLSHKPDDDEKAQQELTKINTWFCEQYAYLIRRLAETPEPGGGGSMLDNTTVVWTNELGKGNSHTLDNIPWVLVGGGLNFRMGRSVKYPKLPHNRLLLAMAHAMGHRIPHFGNPNFCGGGVLPNLT